MSPTSHGLKTTKDIVHTWIIHPIPTVWHQKSWGIRKIQKALIIMIFPMEGSWSAVGTLPKFPLGGSHVWRRRRRGRIHIMYCKGTLHKQINTEPVQSVCTKLKSNWVKIKWENVIMKGNIDVKIFEPKNMLFAAWARNFGWAAWLVARARGSRGDADETKGLGPWRPLGTTILGISREKLNVLP